MPSSFCHRFGRGGQSFPKRGLYCKGAEPGGEHFEFHSQFLNTAPSDVDPSIWMTSLGHMLFNLFWMEPSQSWMKLSQSWDLYFILIGYRKQVNSWPVISKKRPKGRYSTCILGPRYQFEATIGLPLVCIPLGS